MSEFGGRSQVENELRRPLTEDELVVVGSLGELSTAHLAVLRVLVRRQRLAALLYLRALLPDASTPELNEFINTHG